MARDSSDPGVTRQSSSQGLDTSPPGTILRNSIAGERPIVAPSESSEWIPTSRTVEMEELAAMGSPSPTLPSPKERKITRIPPQRSRSTRPSEEFDRRYDGPFGRPSLAMTRRSSSRAGVGSRGRPTTAELSEMEKARGEGVRTPEPGFRPEPPRLNYDLRTRKWSILLFWTVIVVDSVAMPIALYFGLWYGVGPGTNTPTEIREKLSANAVFSIVTAAIGGASIVEYFVRFWRLFKKNSGCRVIGAHRWYLDWFHWNFSFAWIIIMVELIV